MAWRNGKIENSHFLLFEASGDSEVADSNNLGDIEANSNNLGYTEGYDAESCSCEYPGDDRMLDFHEFNDCDHDHDDDKDFSDTDHEDEYCDDCNRRLTDRMMGLSRGSFAAAMEEEEAAEEEVESRFCANGGVDTLIRDDIDENERNRLFWETCLEVGYP